MIEGFTQTKQINVSFEQLSTAARMVSGGLLQGNQRRSSSSTGRPAIGRFSGIFRDVARL
ncbi:hypothetical protein ACIA03_26185 [Nocardioides sp. NPDC051685]|uniref:hypothetical protein n=1 Tax=Nocardioides sp. NPDC051685 TaxID=3364334 RepID=UPI00379184DB